MTNTYSQIKGLALRLIPRSILFRFEYPLRYLYYLKHVGNKYQCNVCEKKLSNFIPLGKDRLCPRCGSLQRSRRLWKILKDEFLKKDQSILDFSPSRCLYRVMKKGPYNYISSDLSGDFNADAAFDIQHIDAPSSTFDLVICYHILEHIEDDTQAMKELWRVLKKGGYCIVQTPFHSGPTYENPLITSPEDRLIHFGQSDHVRIYSMQDLKDRLENAGFNVEIRHFQESPENRHGLRTDESVLICNKSK